MVFCKTLQIKPTFKICLIVVNLSMVMATTEYTEPRIIILNIDNISSSLYQHISVTSPVMAMFVRGTK